MNKLAFLSALRDRLSGMPKDDIDRSIDYYREIIDDRMEDGLTEEEAIAAIGSVEGIASQILMETPLLKLVKAKVKPNRVLKGWEIFLLILGLPLWLPLLAVAACVALSVYVALFATIAALYAADISVAFAGICGIFSFVFSVSVAQGFLFFGAGLACIGIVILLFFGCNRIARGVLIAGKKMLLFTKACLVGKGESA